MKAASTCRCESRQSRHSNMGRPGFHHLQMTHAKRQIMSYAISTRYRRTHFDGALVGIAPFPNRNRGAVGQCGCCTDRNGVWVRGRVYCWRKELRSVMSSKVRNHRTWCTQSLLRPVSPLEFEFDENVTGQWDNGEGAPVRSKVTLLTSGLLRCRIVGFVIVVTYCPPTT